MAKKSVEQSGEFVNPFEPGVNYKDFLDAIPEGVSISEYCNGKIESEKIAWLESDIEIYKNSLKNK